MNPEYMYPKFISNYRAFRKIKVRIFEAFLYFTYNEILRSVHNINVKLALSLVLNVFCWKLLH